MSFVYSPGDPEDVAELAAIVPVVTGKFPCVAHRYLCPAAPGSRTVEAVSALLPAGFSRQRASESEWAVTIVAESVACCVLLLQRGSALRVFVAATDITKAREVLRSICDRVPVPLPDPSLQPARIWTFGMHNSSHTRSLPCPEWASVKRNYPDAVRSQIEELASMTPPDDDSAGRLIVVCGLPGSGKSTLIRVLARSWSDWCSLDLVVDPEDAFGSTENATVLLTTSAFDSEAADDRRGFRLVAADDADALLAAGLRGGTSNSLSRLLSLSSGAIGQGSRTLVLLASNLPMSALPASLLRPGRCLAALDVPAFDGREAASWLGESSPRKQNMVLAELYEAAGASRRIGGPAMSHSYGTYL
jgi:hypothetical protein